MDEFLIQGASGGSLRFFDRDPGDRNRPVESFYVCVTDLGLSATIRVSDGCLYSQPTPLFAEMARMWTGWQGELSWQSLEGELALTCTHDKLGHIVIRAGLRSGFMPDDWRVETTVKAEAGQLDRLARQAASFFGSRDA